MAPPRGVSRASPLVSCASLLVTHARLIVPRARLLVPRTCLFVVAFVLAVEPAAAQSVNRAAINELNKQLLYVALPLTLFVELTIIHAIYRFRDNDDPSPTADDRALEITWTTVTAVILVFVSVSGYVVMANPYLTPAAAAEPVDSVGGEDALEVEVTAYQWGWQFHYPDANVTTQSRLAIPANRDVRLELRSEDVIHSFYVPALGLKQDVFPGNSQVALTNATATGEYQLYCAEFCGAGHSRMDGTVAVLNQSEFRSWLDARTGPDADADTESDS